MLITWLSKLYNHKLTGVLWHMRWKDELSYLGMWGYYAWQKNRIFKEMYETFNMQNGAINGFELMPMSGVIVEAKQYVATITIAEGKEEKLRQFLDTWIEHERDSVNLCIEASKRSLEQNDYKTFNFFNKLCTGALTELQMLEYERMFCVNAEWDLSIIQTRQEYLSKTHTKKYSEMCNMFKQQY